MLWLEIVDLGFYLGLELAVGSVSTCCHHFGPAKLFLSQIFIVHSRLPPLLKCS